MRLHSRARRKAARALAPGAVAVALAASIGLPASRVPAADPADSRIEIGQALYLQHCAACHGGDARGGGDFGTLLAIPPPDLTRIALRHGGDFPAVQVAETIDGRRELRAHGDPDMPIWGERLAEHAPGGQGDEVATRGRVLLLVEYLRSVQVGAAPDPSESFGPTLGEAGRPRFLHDCAPCHGVYGKGNGFLGVLLRQPPPDLTRISQRRGGEFPAREIEAMIDGRREVRAHGPREMPIWGEAYRRTTPPSFGRERVVRAEILLLVEYLRSIQKPLPSSEAREHVPLGD